MKTSPKNFNERLTPDDDQAQQALALSFARTDDPLRVPAAAVRAQTSKRASLLLCMQVSGREDQEIARHLGIDKGQWSRIKSGQAHFPEDKETALMLFCGNFIPLWWQAYDAGWDPETMRPLRTALEAELEASQRRIAELESEHETTMRLLREMRSG